MNQPSSAALEADLYLPEQAKAVTVVLHGLGDSKEGWKGVANELQIEGMGYCFVNAPEPYYGGFSWFPIAGKTEPDHTEEDHRAGLIRSRALLSQFLAELPERCGLTPERLFLMGFSQGCVMVLDHALRSAHRYAGVIGISGYCSQLDDYPLAFGPALPQQHILWTHGSEDPMIPLCKADACRETLQELGINIDWRVYTKAHNVDMANELPDFQRWLSQRLQAIEESVAE